ncbi:hypothetical protein FHX42_001241 [Saccharopolyspora lacisalsi]|uniref:Uncharacterized protein n=1 Tax=Halosaccharopolyspora lacisalsi TaxID=1000566 RepID=A0A839DPI8_9PSEU|nr:hypothetical protein [Halosaccharopolyspora lacisalsi]MBA8823912.1 hypothetical protein [Halosaccharopolyspora lacisalsi]
MPAPHTANVSVEHIREGLRIECDATVAGLVAEAVQLYTLESGSDQLADLAHQLGEATGTDVTVAGLAP